MSVERMGRVLTLALSAWVASGCFHTRIDTGLPQGPVGYEEEWETAWLIGAVPARVDATEACGGPWSRVETQQSLLNGIVTVLTLGIFAPHQVRVTCAATSGLGSAEQAAPGDAGASDGDAAAISSGHDGRGGGPHRP